jgi:hypothetical protein
MKGKKISNIIISILAVLIIILFLLLNYLYARITLLETRLDSFREYTATAFDNLEPVDSLKFIEDKDVGLVEVVDYEGEYILNSNDEDIALNKLYMLSGNAKYVINDNVCEKVYDLGEAIEQDYIDADYILKMSKNDFDEGICDFYEYSTGESGNIEYLYDNFTILLTHTYSTNYSNSTYDIVIGPSGHILNLYTNAFTR